ncbi:MAG: TetR/AcrR family transcriptional regulator [Thermoanaerobaculia bacterium]
MPPTPRQAEILDCAAELVAESGLAQLTMKRLAERVGFTEPALYRHYPGKSALLAAMIERLGGRLLPTMEEIAGDRRLTPRERLLGMVRHHVALLRATRGLPILFLAEGLASGDRDLMASVGGVMRRYLALLGVVTAELGPAGGVSADRQALLFLGLPAAIGIQLRAFPDLALSDEETELIVQHYVRSLTLPAAPAPEKSS